METVWMRLALERGFHYTNVQDFFGGTMTIVDMLGQSAKLTLLGLGVVFLFLVILIFCLGLLRNAIGALKLDVEEKTDTVGGSVTLATSAGDNAVIAAIATALRVKQG
jgi:oxaloacetate decarboxylase gamma subunit